jgi:hypothetical protein
MLVKRRPCPSDAAIARAYGSHSLRRARRLLTYIEEQGLIVCQLDGAGRRIVTLAELTSATAPRDPSAEEVPAEKAASLVCDETVDARSEDIRVCVVSPQASVDSTHRNRSHH